ncbi:methyl-accepting chemotaxis protein [Paenibacillus physcomitrellae]|uniref:Methyl-accepting chemotaxis protein n=1 Tax=Paenibacillus physcomitrellae TaxID=1619311 RepID=A0ABQ1FR48_9BACL|nr:methyl-accepting chemotaxis protein [Paenibacillus physcomitrellae]GGA26208.1 hypothetical protein GCM10010917_08810 [Paenibacillus physcomitrellae]
MWINNLKTGTKLVGLISISILCIALVGMTGFFYMNKIAGNSSSVYQNGLIPVQTIGQFQINNRAIDSYLLEMMVTKDTERLNKLVDNIHTKLEASESALESYEKSNIDKKVVDLINQYKSNNAQFKSELNQTISLSLNGEYDEAYNSYFNKVKPLRSTLAAISDEISNSNNKQAEDLNKSNHMYLKKAMIIMVLTITISVLLSLILGYWIYTMIVRPVKLVQSLMSKAEEGDLTIKGSYKTTDEFGILITSFNDMIHGIRSTIQAVQENAESLAASSEELSSSAEETGKATNEIAQNVQETAIGTERQLVAISETAAIIKNISSNLEEIFEVSNLVSISSDHSSSNARAGNLAVKTVIDQMNTIEAKVNEVTLSAVRLSESSKEIDQIVSFISEVSKQTNLLALNAAIEASRASDQGRGFSVVAAEVKKLSEQTAGSAKQIEQKVALIRQETVNIMSYIGETGAEVNKGVNMAHSAGEAFETIRLSTDEVTVQIENMTTAVEKIAEGSKIMVQAITDIESASENAAAGMQNVSAATEEQLASMQEVSASAVYLAQMSEQLFDTVKKFRIEKES